MKFKKIYLIFGFFFTSLLAEFIIRYNIGLGTPPLYVSYEGMEYKLKANQDIQRFGNNIKINNLGMRTSFDITPKKRLKRILIFGDSVLWGGSKLDQKKIATALLNDKFKNQYEIYNISAGSWGPGNWIEFIKENGLLNADKIILLINSEDLVDIPNRNISMPNINRPTKNPHNAIWELTSRYLMPRGKNLFINIFIKNKNNIYNNVDSDIQKGAEFLNELINIIQSKGIELTAVQFWNKEELESNIPIRYHSIIYKILSSKNIKIIQSSPYFKDCSSNPSNLYVDKIHPFTIKGQACLSYVLEDAINY